MAKPTYKEKLEAAIARSEQVMRIRRALMVEDVARVRKWREELAVIEAQEEVAERDARGPSSG